MHGRSTRRGLSRTYSPASDFRGFSGRFFWVFIRDIPRQGETRRDKARQSETQRDGRRPNSNSAAAMLTAAVDRPGDEVRLSGLCLPRTVCSCVARIRGRLTDRCMARSSREPPASCTAPWCGAGAHPNLTNARQVAPTGARNQRAADRRAESKGGRQARGIKGRPTGARNRRAAGRRAESKGGRQARARNV